MDYQRIGLQHPAANLVRDILNVSVSASILLYEARAHKNRW